MKWSKYNVYVNDDVPQKTIVFNTLSRNLIVLSTKEDDPLIIENPPEHYCDSQTLTKLEKLGTIVPEDIDEALVFKSVFRQGRMDRSLLGLFISFSSSCNFACDYCYESYKSKSFVKSNLSMGNWNKIFGYIYKKVIDGPVQYLDVVMYGGEPLMNYDVMLKGVSDLRGLEKDSLRLGINLITNGSLLNEKRLKELEGKIDSIQFTLDGDQQDHDKSRPFRNGRGSFNRVFENFLKAIDIFGDKVFLRINAGPNSNEKIGSFLRQLADMDINRRIGGLGISKVFPTQTEIESTISPNTLADQNTKSIEKIVDLQRMAVVLGFHVPKNFIDGPCPLLSPTSLSIDENLKVYKCPGYLYQKPIGQIGEDSVLKIYNNFYYEATLTEPECANDCNYGPICYGGCRWQTGALEKYNCIRELHDRLLKSRIKIYVDSLRTRIPIC